MTQTAKHETAVTLRTKSFPRAEGEPYPYPVPRVLLPFVEKLEDPHGIRQLLQKAFINRQTYNKELMCQIGADVISLTSPLVQLPKVGCAEWALAYTLSVPYDHPVWVKAAAGLNPGKHLEEANFTPQMFPKHGDLLMYGDLRRSHEETGEMRPEHFGIFYHGKVVSKFLNHPLFMHELHAIPNDWATHVAYFRPPEEFRMRENIFDETRARC